VWNCSNIAQVERASVRAVGHDGTHAIVDMIDFPSRDDRT